MLSYKDPVAAMARRYKPIQSAVPGTTVGPIEINAFIGGVCDYFIPSTGHIIVVEINVFLLYFWDHKNVLTIIFSSVFIWIKQTFSPVMLKPIVLGSTRPCIKH